MCSAAGAEPFFVLLAQWGATYFAVRGVVAAVGELVRRRRPGGGLTRPARAGTGGGSPAGVLLPDARGCIWSTPRSTAPPAWRGRRAPPTRPPRSRCCPARDCRSPPDTDDRLVHLVKDARSDPAAVEADQVYVGPGRNQSGDDHQRRPRRRSAAIRCGGSPIRACATASPWRTRRSKPLGIATGLGAAGAVGADPRVRARPGAVTRGRVDAARHPGGARGGRSAAHRTTAEH